MLESVEMKSESETGAPAGEEPLICRKVVRRGVVVAALHPVAGPVYWDYTDESECNAPDYYGFTGDLNCATVFKTGYYRGSSFQSFRSYCLNGLVEDDELWVELMDDVKYVPSFNYSGGVNELAKKAGCTPDEFVSWLHQAVWVEYPAPMKLYFLRDFNGYLGYRPEWSTRASDALHWSRKELAEEDDLDVMLARQLGRFVPVSQAEIVSPSVRKASAVNHALEADCALTLDRLGVRRRRDWSVDKSDNASWLGDFREAAWIHAARAGVEHVRSGELFPVSGHIAAFPELLERFEMAAALARHENLKNK